MIFNKITDMYSSATEFVYNTTYGTFKTDKQTQTDDYFSFNILDSESINSINVTNIKKQHFFNHLDFANQTYGEHFLDSISYCGQSIKSAFFFFVHAFWPDFYTQSGSICVHQLSDHIKDKYNKRLEELRSEKYPKPYKLNIEINTNVGESNSNSTDCPIREN